MVGMALGAISLVLAVGCGGGDDSTTTVTKAEFTQQANAICAEAKKQRDAAVAKMDEKYYAVEGKNSKNPANVPLELKLLEEMLDETILPSMKEQLAGLEELGVPAGDEAKVSKMLKTYSGAIRVLEDKRVEGLAGLPELYDFQEEAETYGLDCAVV
jgi:hypothetical protein